MIRFLIFWPLPLVSVVDKDGAKQLLRKITKNCKFIATNTITLSPTITSGKFWKNSFLSATFWLVSFRTLFPWNVKFRIFNFSTKKKPNFQILSNYSSKFFWFVSISFAYDQKHQILHFDHENFDFLFSSIFPACIRKYTNACISMNLFHNVFYSHFFSLEQILQIFLKLLLWIVISCQKLFVNSSTRWPMVRIIKRPPNRVVIKTKNHKIKNKNHTWNKINFFPLKIENKTFFMKNCQKKKLFCQEKLCLTYFWRKMITTFDNSYNFDEKNWIFFQIVSIIAVS